MTPKIVADQTRHKLIPEVVDGIKHFGEACGAMLAREMPVDVICTPDHGATYECYWKGCEVGAYGVQMGMLVIDWPAIRKHAFLLMTDTQRKRHEEGLDEIGLALHGQPRYDSKKKARRGSGPSAPSADD